MGSTAEENGAQKKYKGIRRRKWGKWVSEIRVPGSQNRLWLGSYSTPEAAAVAHDVAFYCLRRPPSLVDINFPLMLPASVNEEMSPKSVQKASSDAGMAVDAQMILNKSTTTSSETEENRNGGIQELDTTQFWRNNEYFGKTEEEELSISVDDYKVEW